MNRLVTIIVWLIFVTASAEIIPSSRRITWDPGVRGGIPNRTTIYTNLPTSVTTTAFQSALNAASAISNRVVQLTNGTYTLTDLLVLPTGVTLRGNGISNTIITAGAGFGPSRLIDFDNGFDDSWGATPRNITAGNTKGSTNITTSVAHGWTAGDLILIDMLEQSSGDPPIDAHGSLGDCNWCGRAGGTRPIGQLVTILTTPTTTTATIDPPLYWAYSNTPQGVEMTGLTKFAGIEDLTIDNRTPQAQDIIGWFGAVNCWTKRVEQRGIYRRSDWLYTALWWQKEGCIIHEGIPVGTDFTSAYTSDRSYGPFLGMCTAGLLIDSAMHKLTMGWAVEGPAAGNVQAYNFVTNIWWTTTGGDSPRRFGPLMHGPHPFMNLVEGNFSAGRFRADAYWGTSSHWTVLRNRIIQIDRGTGDAQTWTVDVEAGNWYYSFVGNLLGGGDSVSENNYEYATPTSSPYSDSNSTIYRWGYDTITAETSGDTNVFRTAIRSANWSFRTNNSVSGSGVLSFTNNVTDVSDTSPPQSYYLSSAPSFFSSGSGGPQIPWPPFDPYNTTMSLTNKIPAQLRYEGITNYQLAAATAPLITSSTNQISTNFVSYSYQITTDVAVDTYGATNLPNGLTVGGANGLISGVIDISNVTTTNDVGLAATNSSGFAHTNMALKIVALANPVINSPTTYDGTNGVLLNPYQITGTQYPTNFGASGLPTGLSVGLETGLITGTPTVDGVFMVTLRATNAVGSDTETLTLTIDPPAPVISVSPSSLTFAEIAETQTSDLVFGITNTGGASSTLTGNLHTTASPFSVVAPTNFSLAGGTGTNMTVRYSPTSKGTNTGVNAIFESNAGNVTNALTGVAYPLATSWVDIPMTNALINAPFVIHSGNYIFQTNSSSATDGGRAVYGFTVTNAGTFTFAGKTFSTSLADDSFYFNIDADPVDPDHNWALIGPTSFTTNKSVTWPPYPNPPVQSFTLGAGIHKMVLRGREGGAQDRTMTVTQTSGGGGGAPSPNKLQIIGPVTGSGVTLR